jgi:hypothetical protein
MGVRVTKITGSRSDEWMYLLMFFYNYTHKLTSSILQLLDALWLKFVRSQVQSRSRLSFSLLSLSLMLWLTVGQQVCLGIKHPFGAYDKIFITIIQLQVCWWGALSLTRGRVCRLQLLLGFASAVILGSESRGTHDHILPSQIRDFRLRCLLRLTGLWFSHSTPPPHWITLSLSLAFQIALRFIPLGGWDRKHLLDEFPISYLQ